MTLSSTENRVSYAGNDRTTAFTFPYLFFANSHLTVILVDDATGVETTQTITTHYTVTGAGNSSGGTVTMVTAPATDETLVIVREVPLTQGLDLEENDPFPSNSVEQQFDTLTMLAQQLNTEVERSMKLSEGDTSGVSVTLPTPTALNLIRWNAGLTAFENVTIADLAAIVISNLDPEDLGTAASGTSDEVARGDHVHASGLGTTHQAYDIDTTKNDVANTFTKTQTWTKGSDVASVAALVLGDGNYFDITGTTTITSVGTKGVGTTVKLHFDEILTLTHHATDLILPSAANIMTAAGDEFEFTEYAAGDWRCTGYALASGEAIVGTGEIALETPVAAASQTSIDFTGISADAKRININFDGFSKSGTSLPLIQIGDTGGIEATNYLGSGTILGVSTGGTLHTTGFGLEIQAGANVWSGTITLSLLDASANTWSCNGDVGLSDAAFTAHTGGAKSLSAVLDRVRITTVGGTDTFDAGTVNISVET